MPVLDHGGLQGEISLRVQGFIGVRGFRAIMGFNYRVIELLGFRGLGVLEASR